MPKSHIHYRSYFKETNMIDSHTMINPIIQGESTDTLLECSNCLDYLTQTANSTMREELSPQAYVGLGVLMECVAYAIRYEAERLNKQPAAGVDLTQ
jgi:hypothetical protein